MCSVRAIVICNGLTRNRRTDQPHATHNGSAPMPMMRRAIEFAACMHPCFVVSRTMQSAVGLRTATAAVPDLATPSAAMLCSGAVAKAACAHHLRYMVYDTATT